jgi:flagellar biosynthesis/type III secretory pathway protein FliH
MENAKNDGFQQGMIKGKQDGIRIGRLHAQERLVDVLQPTKKVKRLEHLKAAKKEDFKEDSRLFVTSATTLKTCVK